MSETGFFRGRGNGVINVGGNKVHPEEVERALLTHLYVAIARVYAKANPVTGAGSWLLILCLLQALRKL